MPIKNKLVIIDGPSKDLIEREMTQEELTELNSQQINPDDQIANVKAKQVKRQALLTRLGITAEEAVLLLS